MRLSFFIFTCLFVFCFCDSLFVFYRHFVCLFLSLHDCLFVVTHILPILTSRLFVFIVACLFVFIVICLFVVSHILPILASRTVDDGEASADEVVLHVHNDER